MWPTIQAAIKQVQAGVYTAQDFGSFSLMAKGGASLAPLHDWDKKLPADVKDAVLAKQKDIVEGNFRVNVDESTPKSE